MLSQLQYMLNGHLHNINIVMSRIKLLQINTDPLILAPYQTFPKGLEILNAEVDKTRDETIMKPYKLSGQYGSYLGPETAKLSNFEKSTAIWTP